VKLPNATRAVVEIEKLRDYCLNPTHPRGRHKARVFAFRLGLNLKDAETLRHALIRAAADHEAVATIRDQYGQRYVIDFEMNGLTGAAMVRSAWIVALARAPRGSLAVM
jgi:hypothetical protein